MVTRHDAQLQQARAWQFPPRMAAVFALIFLFVIASIGFMFKALPDASFGSLAMIATFVMMASGIFVGLYKLARRWENETPTGD